MIRTHLYSLLLDRISPGQFCMVAHTCNMFNRHLKSLNEVTAALALYVPDQFWLLLAQPWYFMTRPYSSNHGRWMNTLLCGEIFSAVWWDLVRFCEISWDLVRYGEILWHLVRIGKILRDMVRFSEIQWDSPIQWDFVRYCKSWWDTCMVRFGEIWYMYIWCDLVHLVRYGVIW